MKLSALLTAIVATIHVFLMLVEMFAWTTRAKDFLVGLPPETFEPSQILAMNVGLYNGFLAFGLSLAIFMGLSKAGLHLAITFLTFISIAGAFGAATADWKLLLVQTLPATLALAALLAMPIINTET